jgi:hypothetical protein
VELCKKKEKNLTPLEKILAHYGDAWVWLGFDPVSKVLLALVVGKRTKANAYRLVERRSHCLRAMSCATMETRCSGCMGSARRCRRGHAEEDALVNRNSDRLWGSDMLR